MLVILIFDFSAGVPIVSSFTGCLKSVGVEACLQNSQRQGARMEGALGQKGRPGSDVALPHHGMTDNIGLLSSCKIEIILAKPISQECTED